MKNASLKKKLMIERLNMLLKGKKGKLLELEYYEKTFGNIIVRIEADGVLHTFITDRGDIYCDSKFMCDSSYHVQGRDDTFDKLYEIIQEVLILKD